METCFCFSCVNDGAKIKKSFLSRLALFSKNHPVLLFAVLAGCFLLVPNVMFAADDDAWYVRGIIWILYGVYLFFSQIVTLAATLFLWAIDTNVFSGLLNNGAVYEVWLVVRDFCNIFFILVLLFSAFATIFQLDKYEYKKTIPMLILMALLVNFSFPISRVVIDVANVPMYFFAQNVFGTSGINITSQVLSASKIQDIILPNIKDADTAAKQVHLAQMLAAVVCMFLFGISFLVLAVLMLIRMIALTMLVMFSPIGFVGLITPALQKYAHDWWDRLFKYAFYGPIAVMLVLVAIIVMKAGADVQAAHKMQNLAGEEGLSTFIANIAFFTIPIVLFWIAITSAEKYSNDMSGLGIKFGSNMGRKVGGWVRKGTLGTAKWTAKAPLKATDWMTGNRISGTALGIREAWRNRRGWGGKDMKERQELASARMEGRLSRGGSAANAERDYVNKKAREIAEENKKNGRLENDVRADLQIQGDDWRSRARRKAAAMTLSERELLTGTPNTTTLPGGGRGSDFEAALAAAGDDMDLVASITKKAPKEMINNAENLSMAFESVNRTIEAAINRMPNANQQDVDARNRERTRLRDRTMGSLIEKSSGSALAGEPDQMKRIMTSFGGDTDLERALTGKMKKEGKIKNLIDYRISEAQTKYGKENGGQSLPQEAIQKIYEANVGKYNAEELGKQSNLMGDAAFQAFFKSKMNSRAFDVNDYNRFLRFAEGKTEEQERFRAAMGQS